MFGMSDFILYIIFSRKTKLLHVFLVFYRESKKRVHLLSFEQPLLKFRLDPTVTKARNKQKLLVL